MIRPDYCTDEMLEYLDELRKSGETNMFGAVPYIREQFPELGETSAALVLVYWMKTFKERSTKSDKPVLESKYDYLRNCDFGENANEDNNMNHYPEEEPYVTKHIIS